MAITSKIAAIVCLDCEQQIHLGYQPVVGQILLCPHCKSELEIICMNPLELDFYYEDEEEDENWEEYAEWEFYGDLEEQED